MIEGTYILDAIKIFTPAAVAFFLGISITPFVANYLYKHRMWKKKSVLKTTDGRDATISQQLHNDEGRKTPRMGGIVVWGSILLTITLFWLISLINGSDMAEKLNFLSRNQTWLPLFTLITGALIGLADDYLETSGAGTHIAGGLSLTVRLSAVFLISLVGAWWFFFKLDYTSVLVPFVGEIVIGFLFIPLFILVTILLYSGGVIDGLDGLSGGVFSSIFAAYGIIAFAQHQVDLATFCFVVVGALLAFLWFNIPPARFFLSETGTMALTVTLSVIAFLTEHVFLLLIIALPLIATSFSSALQIASKRCRKGKRVFKVAPLHHHFQAIGWPHYKVTMRYWVFSIILAFLGVIIALIG